MHPITIEQVQCLKGTLERTVAFFVDARDLEGEKLRHDARGLLCTAELIETAMAHGVESASDLDELASVLERGRQLIATTRRYAEARRLRYLVVETPAPVSDRTVVMSREEIAALMGAAGKGATEPPPAIAEMLAENVNELGAKS